MSFNWGVGIAVFYGLFMVAMVAVVLRSTQFDHALVAEDYYAEDLKYQQHFDKLENTRALAEPPSIGFTADRQGLELAFPEALGVVRGEVVFFRPSDQGADFKVPLSLDEGRVQVIPTTGLDPGLWRVQVDWKSGDKAFYSEKVIIL